MPIQDRGRRAIVRWRDCACWICRASLPGPVAGRTLAVHGADVMLISSPDLPAIPWLTIDTGRGKLSSFVDLKTGQGREVLRGLLAAG